MKQSKYYLLIAMIFVAILFALGRLPASVRAGQSGVAAPTGTTTPPPQENQQERAVDVAVPEDIKSVIQSYFDVRYQAFSTLQLGGFGDLVSDSPEARAWLDAELGKLAVEIKHAELNQLRYAEYEYSLNFNSINALSQTAAITVIEKYDVIFESQLNVENPHVTHMTGREHTITLRQEQGEWKIVSDDYTDYLWRMLRRSDISTDVLVDTMKAAPRGVSNNANKTEYHCPILTMVSYQGEDYYYGVDYSDTSVHAYGPAERVAAVTYAQTYTDDENGDDEYNLYYPSYDGEVWGDCTNFVSQALYEGGNISMFIPDPLPARTTQGQSGWYLLNGMQRATDWDDVGGFYSFVINPSAYISEGPEGCSANDPNTPDDDVTIDDIDVGDIIQYEEASDGDDSVWDHSIIVVGFTETANGERIALVASHSDDHREIDYRYYAYDDIRFIHIERSDGNPPVIATIEAGTDDAGTNPTGCTFSSSDNEVYLGACFDATGDITSGFRFNNIEIPPGANIKYAYITFSVDGEYTVPLSLEIYGEKNGNSEPFDNGNPHPDSRPTTIAKVDWVITDTWRLTDNHAGISDPNKYSFTTPQLADVIEEIVGQRTWASGNSLSIIFKNADSTEVRRVIARERADDEEKLFSARLVIAYEGGSSVPTATLTATATPTLTATPTSTPTSTPTPVRPTNTPVPTNTPGAEPTSDPWWGNAEKVLMKDEPAQKNEDFSNLLSQIRDQVLRNSSKGDEYIDMVYEHAPEIMTMFIKNEGLRLQVKELALEAQPLLESMVDDDVKGKQPRLSKAWIEKTLQVLEIAEKQASPALRQEIQWWRKYLPDFAGKTGNEIWEMLPKRDK